MIAIAINCLVRNTKKHPWDSFFIRMSKLTMTSADVSESENLDYWGEEKREWI